MQAPTFEKSIAELKSVLNLCAPLANAVHEAGSRIQHSLLQGKKLLSCGNGGSAADALHLAEELVGRYKIERRALPGICLNADATALTCICNDYGYEHVFSRPVEALGSAGDVLVGFSTSGNSANIIAAFHAAAKRKITTILLGGRDGGQAKNCCDLAIIVPSDSTARIQEVHTLILHQWLELLDATNWDTLP